MYTHPQHKTLLVLKKPHHGKKQIHHIEPLAGSISRRSPSPTLRPRVEPLKNILDRFADSQRKDVTTFFSGHLNPNNANYIIQKANDELNPPIVSFGKKHARASSAGSKGATDGNSSVMKNASSKNEPEKLESTVHRSVMSPESNQSVNMEKMIDILTQFDSVKITKPEISEPGESQLDSLSTENGKEAEKGTDALLIEKESSLTKTEKYQTYKTIDKSFIGRPEYAYKKISDAGQKELLSKFYTWLEQELEARECPSEGPDWGRLQVFSLCFDHVISQFKAFAPLLSEIKKEYDKTVQGFKTEQEELQFLRTKVQKLLSQNENRMLLKFERRKGKELEAQVEGLRHENDRLRTELRRKLAIYASYLPASILHEKKKEDPLLAEMEASVVSYNQGEDPITLQEKKIDQLESEINRKIEEIEELKRIQEREFVPKMTKEKIEEAHRHLEEKLKQYIDKNNDLESQLMKKQSDIRQLEFTLREKEQQYQFLMTEYNELANAMASTIQESKPEISPS